jgi:nitric oxide reductase subunit C
MPTSDASDPAFWRAGAISTTVVMLVVLVFLTIDSLDVIRAGGAHVPAYTAINQEIGYGYNLDRGYQVPTIGGEQPIFGRTYSEAEARDLIAKGKLVIQSRACMDCHTFFGNGAYYGPDLTKAWLDPVWDQLWKPMTGQATREGAIAEFLMHPEKYPTWSREMPNLGLTRDEAVALVAYLKWMSAVDANGFPANFGTIQTQTTGGGAHLPPAVPRLGAEASAPESRTLTLTELVAVGEKAYGEHCAACHQANGLGIPGTFPPIAGDKPYSAPEALLKPMAERGFYAEGKIVQGPVKQHIDIVLNGIPGTPMPPLGAQLDDGTVAAIVTYERNAFGNHTGDTVQAADVRAARVGQSAAGGGPR